MDTETHLCEEPNCTRPAQWIAANTGTRPFIPMRTTVHFLCTRHYNLRDPTNRHPAAPLDILVLWALSRVGIRKGWKMPSWEMKTIFCRFWAWLDYYHGGINGPLPPIWLNTPWQWQAEPAEPEPEPETPST